ncbi:helix-hairpin-helix domain-containing protein [Paenisporosarcina indica]|uniref:helix-hairpin-helix domain-containing protein n=1 Tax=Paenisporosarcina indica TaxID=650093 RepID=UPI000A00C347|nr:helix-hairpin-helix domain-containing protein [Paenisporosarcina indica]
MPEPPISGTLETIQNPIPKPIPPEESTETNPTSSKESEAVIVDVKGQVKTPGVYTLPIGSRVLDAVQQAGGLLPTAEERALNLASRLIDEMVIYVPTIGEMEEPIPFPSSPSNPSKDESQSTIVNINSADETTLMTLSGIGPSKAKAILTYRDENGSFQSIEEIKEVTGIGDSTFNNIKDFISVK